jgi:hydroxymethylpyrimidine pyrophosphatase-like HAD family hydrolase
MKIAVDFDGTIVEHIYPKIGKPMPFAFETLKELKLRGHEIILWTYRAGNELDEAVQFCKKNGLEFYAINQSYPDEIFDQTISRKIYADIYIDDRNIGGFPGWSYIWKLLNNDESVSSREFFENLENKKITFSDKLKKLFS